MRRGRPPAAPYEAIDKELADVFAEWSDRWRTVPWPERLPALMRKVRETVAAGSERELARGIVRKPPVTSPALKRASRVSEGLALRPIIARVGEAFGIPERLLRRPERTVTAVSEVRELVVWVLREAVPHPVPSFPVIGLALGGRDHSTIISAYRKAVARVDADPALRARLIALGCEASGLRSAA